jgi:hypothetical protein
MIGRLFARLEHADGLYHYGLTTNPAPERGPLHLLEVTGDGESSPVPGYAATAAEHERWIADLRQRGFTVTMTPVNEPAS